MQIDDVIKPPKLKPGSSCQMYFIIKSYERTCCTCSHRAASCFTADWTELDDRRLMSLVASVGRLESFLWNTSMCLSATEKLWAAASRHLNTCDNKQIANKASYATRSLQPRREGGLHKFYKLVGWRSDLINWLWHVHWFKGPLNLE